MILFDVANRGLQKPATRVTVLGSCRVRDPMLALAQEGRAAMCGITPFATFTPLDALQTLRLVDGAIEIEPDMRPMALDTADLGGITRSLARSRAQSDAYIVEISESRAIACGPYVFQNNYFFSQFVQPRGRPLMPWFRELTVSGRVSPETADGALEALRAAGQETPAFVERVIRDTWLRTLDLPGLVAGMRELIAVAPEARWLFAPKLAAPGEAGTRGAEARRLVETVEKAAAEVGAAFYDPSRLIERAGRERALAENGGDIYHYAPEFLPTAGAAYLAEIDRLFGGEAPRDMASSVPPDLLPAGARRLPALARWLDGFMVAELVKRQAALGPLESGLYAHYENLVARGSVLEKHYISVAEVVCKHLPRYDRIIAAGALMGEAAFLLALAGENVDAFETMEKRRAAMVAMRDDLVDIAADGLAERLRCHDPLPKQLDPQGSCLFLAIDFINCATADHPAIFETIRACDGVLIIPRTFLKTRTEEEQEAACAMIVELGFARRREYPIFGFVYFERQPGART